MSSPTDYEVSGISQLIRVLPEDYMSPEIEDTVTMTLRWNSDYATIVGDNDEQFCSILITDLALEFPDVQFDNCTLSEGKIQKINNNQHSLTRL